MPDYIQTGLELMAVSHMKSHPKNSPAVKLANAHNLVSRLINSEFCVMKYALLRELSNKFRKDFRCTENINCFDVDLDYDLIQWELSTEKLIQWTIVTSADQSVPFEDSKI